MTTATLTIYDADGVPDRNVPIIGVIPPNEAGYCQVFLAERVYHRRKFIPKRVYQTPSYLDAHCPGWRTLIIKEATP